MSTATATATATRTPNRRSWAPAPPAARLGFAGASAAPSLRSAGVRHRTLGSSALALTPASVPAPERRPAPAAAPLQLAPPSRRRPQAAAYRRRRLVAALALLVTLVLTGRAAGSLLSTASAGEPARTPVVLVAEPGDSYWSLAAEVHEGGDLRSTVDALVDANGGRELRAGDRIVLGG